MRSPAYIAEKMNRNGKIKDIFDRPLDKIRPTGHIAFMKKQNHYDKILSTALMVFHDRGFNDTGTQEIVDLAGVSKGSFYNHFKSKDALGIAALDLYWESHDASLKLLRAPNQPALTRIDNYFKSVAYDEKGCLIGNFSTELSTSDLFRQRLSELFKLWTTEMTECLSAGQKDGSIRTDQSATDMAEFVISSLQGTILRAKAERDPRILTRFQKSTSLYLASCKASEAV